MAGKGKKAVKLIDDETFVFLGNQTKEDYRIIDRIGIEKHITEFRFEHSERFNNWKTDELYIEQANAVEAGFLEKVQDSEMANVLTRHAEDAASQKAIFEDQRTFNKIVNEMKSLTIQCAQNKAAAERSKRAKAILKERRNAVRQHLARIEARQERERKSLAMTQARSLKQKKLVCGTVIRDVEDPEIRVIISGKEFNPETLAEENAKTNAVKAEADKKFHAMTLAQMVVNTKEIEHIREEHLVYHKYATRYCERELEIMDENEALIFDHTAKEHNLEAAQKAQVNAEEDRIAGMVASSMADEAELRVKAAASAVRESQRKDARRLKAQQTAEAIERENEFWEKESVFLLEHLKKKNLEDRFDSLKAEFLSRKANAADASNIEDHDEDDDNSKINESAANIEAMRARELALLEGLKKEHRQALKRLKAVHLKIREQNRAEQQRTLKAILAARDDDISELKAAQNKEMTELKEVQFNSKSDEDAKNKNDHIYALLPKSMAEVLKSGKNVTPKLYENLTFLSATISNGITLANKSTPSQYLTLLNRLWVAFDSAIDGFEDIVKLDMDGDSYTIVSGIQSEGKSSKAVAANVVAFGLALVAAAHEVDMSDQIVDSVTIKIGIHSGSAVGGISNPAFPKLSFLGDAPAIAKLMEDTSRAGGVHVSGHTQELVKDKYTCDVSESINFKTQRVSSFWVSDESSKKRGASRGGNAQ